MSAYLELQDCPTFGVSSVTLGQIEGASALIDGYLSRPEGLLWAPDANGTPVMMAGLQPALSLVLTSAIAPGTMVSATVSGPTSMVDVGAVYIADIANPTATEALVVQSVTGNTIIFKSASFAHVVGAVLASGLTITEQRTMPQGRPITQVSRSPIVNTLSGVGRYGYQRRGDDGVNYVDTYNLLAVMSKFGGPPGWEPFTLEPNSIDPRTGQVWVPAGVLLAYYTEVKIHYIAGWTYATLPKQIKQACANIIQTQTNVAGLGDFTSYKAGDTQITRFAGKQGPTAIGPDTAALLSPFKARAFG